MKIRTTITMSKPMVQRLNRLKYKYDCSSLEEVIDRLLDLLSFHKLYEEFKNIKERKKEWKKLII